MYATLIFNPNAGNTDQMSVEEILSALEESGFTASYFATENEEELDDILSVVEGLVVAAGGDGTIRAVVSRLLGKNAWLTPIPMGTANNLSYSLEITRDPREVLSGLSGAKVQPIDVGRVHSPFGVDYFMESAGIGAFAEILKLYEPEKGKSLWRGLNSILAFFNEFEPVHCQITLDGRDISGKYFMVEAFNIPLLGPRLKFAPEADSCDGLLDVILIQEEARQTWVSFLTSLLCGEVLDHPAVERQVGKNLKIAWEGFAFHLDAVVQPNGNASPASAPQGDQAGWLAGMIEIDVLPQAINLLLPRGEGEKQPANSEYGKQSQRDIPINDSLGG